MGITISFEIILFLLFLFLSFLSQWCNTRKIGLSHSPRFWCPVLWLISKLVHLSEIITLDASTSDGLHVKKVVSAFDVLHKGRFLSHILKPSERLNRLCLMSWNPAHSRHKCHLQPLDLLIALITSASKQRPRHQICSDCNAASRSCHQHSRSESLHLDTVQVIIPPQHSALSAWQ